MGERIIESHYLFDLLTITPLAIQYAIYYDLSIYHFPFNCLYHRKMIGLRILSWRCSNSLISDLGLALFFSLRYLGWYLGGDTWGGGTWVVVHAWWYLGW